VAESEEDMNKWVEYVCHVCGLKAYKDEDGMSVDNPDVLLIKLLIIFLLYWHKVEVRGSLVVKVLGYKPEGCGFETR
jgi:hypothetical protein